MKIKYSIEMARTNLKEAQEFFNSSRTFQDGFGKTKIAEKPMKVLLIDEIIQELHELMILYKKNNQNGLWKSTIITLRHYSILKIIAEANGWTEIKNLDFDEQDFEKNANFIFKHYNK